MKRLICIFIMTLILFVFIPVKADSRIENAKTCYWEYLTETNAFENGESIQYAFVDISGDKLPEMFWTYDSGFHVEICTYNKKGYVKKIDSIRGAYLKIYPNKKMYYHGGTNTGETWYNYCKVKGQKSIILTEKYGNDTVNAVTGKRKPYSQLGKMGPYRYSVKGKTVSKAKYKKYVKKILKGAKAKRIKWKYL